MKKFSLLSLLLVSALAWATIPNHSYHLTLTPSGKADSRYPNGDDGTAAIPLTWSTIPALALTNGASGSVNLASSYLSQPGSPNATLVTTCSTPLPTAGFSFSDPTLTWSSTTTTAISCTASATRSGVVALSNQFNLSSVAGAGADVTAPVTPSISSVTCPSTTECDITVLPMNDPAIPGAATSGLKDVRIYRNGTLITTQTVSPGLSLPLVDVAIATTGGSAVQTGSSWALTSTGTSLEGTSDSADFLTLANPISGDFDITLFVSSWSNSYQFAKVGAAIRKTLAANSQGMWAILFPTPTNIGENLEGRNSTGASQTTENYVAGITAPLCIRLNRTVSSGLFAMYTSPDCNSWTLRQSRVLAMTDPVYPGIILGGASGSTLNVTVSRVSINNLAPVVYQDTGRTAGTTYTYTADARDNTGTPNVSTVSAAVTGTTPATVSAVTWPRLGAYPFSGDNDYASAASQTWLSFQDVVMLGTWNGGQPTWGTVVSGIINSSPLPIKPKVFAYFDSPQVYNICCADTPLHNAMVAGNWLLKTTYPNGTVVPGFFSSTRDTVNLYFPGGNTYQGLTVWQYWARYQMDVYLTGGSYGLATFGNSAAPALSGFFEDDLNYEPYSNGDYTRDGTSDSASDPTIWPGWQAGYEQIFTEISNQSPGMLRAANLSQFGQDQYIAHAGPFLNYFDGGVLENMLGLSFAYETWGGFSAFVTAYKDEFTMLKGPKLGIVGHVVTGLNGADATDTTPYRAAWYGMTATWIMGDGMYYADAGGIDDKTWFDYYAVDPASGVTQTYSSGVTASGLKWLGTPNGPAQSIGSGMYARFWTNGAHGGVCIVNPKANGTQNITTAMLGGSGVYRRVTGSQRPTWDTGATVTGNISIVARDGICLQKI